MTNIKLVETKEKDYAVTVIQDVVNSVEAFGSIVMDEDGEFDDMLPEYIAFSAKHSIVF